MIIMCERWDYKQICSFFVLILNWLKFRLFLWWGTDLHRLAQVHQCLWPTGLFWESVNKYRDTIEAHADWRWTESSTEKLSSSFPSALAVTGFNCFVGFAFLWCIFLLLVHYQLAFIRSLFDIFLFWLVRPCVFS